MKVDKEGDVIFFLVGIVLLFISFGEFESIRHNHQGQLYKKEKKRSDGLLWVSGLEDKLFLSSVHYSNNDVYENLKIGEEYSFVYNQHELVISISSSSGKKIYNHDDQNDMDMKQINFIFKIISVFLVIFYGYKSYNHLIKRK